MQERNEILKVVSSFSSHSVENNTERLLEILVLHTSLARKLFALHVNLSLDQPIEGKCAFRLTELAFVFDNFPRSKSVSHRYTSRFVPSCT